MMKSGAEVLVAGVRVDEVVLVVPFPLPFPFPVPVPLGACLCFVAAFFFDIPAAGALAGALLPGAFLTGIFLLLAIA